jgi:hypothetical protein
MFYSPAAVSLVGKRLVNPPTHTTYRVKALMANGDGVWLEREDPPLVKVWFAKTFDSLMRTFVFEDQMAQSLRLIRRSD